MAFQVRLPIGQTIRRVGDQAYASDILVDAVAHPVEGVVRFQVEGRTSGTEVSISYVGGLRYPWLERDPTKPDLLTPFLRARSGG